jgi:5-methyltetrahydropteroyltriglutamate--homocysteine methyltransferase
VPESVYPDLDEFWADIETAYSAEVRGLYELGCRYLQLDDTALAFLTDDDHRAQLAEGGGDPEHQHEVYIAAINRVLADRPEDFAVTVHICRGNHASGWQASGGYDPIAEALFSDLDVDGYFLEYDSDRAGSFEPLRFVPPGKQVVLGLITSKGPELESKDDLKRRIDEAAHYVPLEQLSLSPQCGFASTEQGNKLTYDEQRAKLNLVVETADEVWS